MWRPQRGPNHQTAVEIDDDSSSDDDSDEIESERQPSRPPLHQLPVLPAVPPARVPYIFTAMPGRGRGIPMSHAEPIPGSSGRQGGIDTEFPSLRQSMSQSKSRGNDSSKSPTVSSQSSDKMKFLLRELLADHPEGLPKSKLHQEFAKKCRQGIGEATNAFIVTLKGFPDLFEEYVKNSLVHVKLKSQKPVQSGVWGTPAKIEKWPEKILLDISSDNDSDVVDITGEREHFSHKGETFVKPEEPVIDLTRNSGQFVFSYPRGTPIPSPMMMDPRQVVPSVNLDSVVFGCSTPGDKILGSLSDHQVKPIIRRTFEKKDIGVKSINMQRGQRINKVQLDSITKDCIEMLSDANEHVSMERIEKLILQRFGIRYLRDLGMNDVRYLDQIPCVFEHNRMLCKVNAYVQAFVKTRSICSLFELSENLREFVQDKDDFKALRLGPLQRLPVVYEQFRFPPDDADIPEITSIDVLEHIRTYMNKFQKWKERLDLQEVMNYIVDQYGVDSAYTLGVRIRSLPLAAQVLKKAGRDAACSRRSVTEYLTEELKKDISSVFQKYRASILQTSSEGDLEMRQHYLHLQPVQAIREIFMKFNLLMSTDQPTNKAARKQQMKLKEVINNFLLIVRDDDLGRNILHLAICVSNTVLEEAAMEMLAPSQPQEMEETTTQHQQLPPRKEKLLENLKKYMDRCVSHGSLSLSHLNRIEEKLLEDFEFTSFAAMGSGSFLALLLGEAKHILEECGGTVLGSTSGSHEGESIYQPSHTDVLEFISQCMQSGCSESEKMEAALCSHYAVKEARHLGFGNMKRLCDLAGKQGKHNIKDNTVIFEGALSANLNPVTGLQKQVGILGHKTREMALACLHNCPLLCDLDNWSCWEMVFAPEHGRLRDFIQKYGGLFTSHLEGGRKSLITDIMALEVKPGSLLKLSTQSSPDLFAEAVNKEDVILACGLLTSLVVLNKGIENTPVALLANHMKSALLHLHAIGCSEDTPSDYPELDIYKPDRAVQFVLRCLVKLPVKIAISLANQIFLDPLGHAVGSSKSKALLLHMCQTVEEETRLEELGCLLGVGEWSQHLQKRFSFVPVVVQEVSTFEADELFDEPEESEEESESGSDTSSDTSFLSDEDDEQPVKETDVETKDKTNMTEKDESENEKSDSEPGESESVKESVLDDEQSIEVDEKDSELNLSDSFDMLPSKEEKCHKTIDNIRRDEFGIGVELNEAGQRLMKVQQERLGRSLDRLSKDLYSKDTHFVLELVQNADDNDYPAEMSEEAVEVCPSVKFEMDTKGITVLNNECGFREKNIRALCDVGRSTKGKHKFGYIGQKGIGFKSVFRVTDKPEVHSNGYHICFDVKSGPMGYILPHWLEEKWEIQEGWTTRIELPLKDETRVHARSLAARFNDIHPSLLLFLHRLRQIVIDNKIDDTVEEIRRVDCGDNIVDIHHAAGVDRWLVIKKLLDASKISLQAKSGVDVESTEIALAFPLQPKSQRMQCHVPEKQPVFAFLPLRTYGFRFIVQGDFDVPSSREDVDRDSPWNQWIRNEIHSLFIEALKVFKDHPGMSEIEAVTAFLQFVPMEDEVLDFFKPVASQILQKLRARQCVPVQPSSKGILWKIPSQTIIARDQLVKDVISPELLQTHLNLFYLHGDVAAMLNPMLTKSLGIEVITTHHLLKIGKALSVSWESAQHPEDMKIEVVSKLLACVYRSMDEFQDNESVLETLRSLKLIPLVDGTFVAVSDCTVFFPVEFRDAHKKKQDPLLVLQKDLRSFHPGLLNSPDNEVNSQVSKIVLQMGVKQLSPSDVIHHHILPVLKSPLWQEKSREALVCYIVFIKLQWERDSTSINMMELKSIAQVLTNHGMKNPQDSCVHFTPHYGNNVTLSQVFPGYDWVLLDGCYMNIGNQNRQEIQKWRDFFMQLGITDFLDIRQETVQLTSENIDKTVWAPLKEMLQPLEDGMTVVDSTCPELHSLITDNKHPDTYQQQMQALFDLLNQGWDSKYSKYTSTQVCNAAGQLHKETETSFSCWLRTLSWLPAIRVEVTLETDGLVTWQEHSIVMQPSCLYVRSQELEKILAHTVPYVNVNLSSLSSFGQYIGLKNDVDVEVVKQMLIQWGQRENPSQPACFCTCLDHIKAVYILLFEKLPPKQLQDVTHQNAVIWVPRSDSRIRFGPVSHQSTLKPANVTAGTMMTRDELWWEDKTGLFNKHATILSELHSDVGKKRSIKELYSDPKEMTDFFKRGVKIQSYPSMVEYCELLILISSALSISEKAVLSDTLQLYITIGDKMSKNPDDPTKAMMQKLEKAQVLKLIKKQTIFASKKDIWVSLEDMPLISDSKEYEKMFINYNDVHFLQLDDKSRARERQTRQRQRENQSIGHESVLKFMEICGIKKLSESLKTEEVTEMLKPLPMIQLFVHRIAPMLQQYLYVWYADVYQKLIDDGVRERLKNLSFFQVSKLEVIYSLLNRPQVCHIRTEKCILSGQSFLFHMNHVGSFPDINREIAKFFSSGSEDCLRDLKGFLSELTPAVMGQTEDTVEEILSRHEVTQLPETEELWEVPAPQLPVYQAPLLEEPEPISDQTHSVGEMQRDQDGKERSLTSWPPIAGSFQQKSTTKSGSLEEKPASKTWPPPKAPDYMKSIRELPSQFKVLSDKVDESEDRKSNTGEGRRGDGLVGERAVEHRTGQNTNSSSDGHVSRESSGVDNSPKSREYVKGDTGDPIQNAGPGKYSGTGSHHGVTGGESSAVRQLSQNNQSMSDSHGNRPTAAQFFESQEQKDGLEGVEAGGPVPPRKRQLTDDDDDGAILPSPKKPAIYFGDPVWTEMASEYTYEELGKGQGLPIPPDMKLSTGVDKEKTSRWGEMIVFHYLLQQKEMNSHISKVVWCNEGNESRLPYDFAVHCCDQQREWIMYIEVKSTISDSKEFFEISSHQVLFAQEKQENFHIYRVFSAGDPENVQLVRIDNLFLRLEQKQVRLCMLI